MQVKDFKKILEDNKMDFKAVLDESVLSKTISVKKFLQESFDIRDVYIKRAVALLFRCPGFDEFYDKHEQLKLSREETTMEHYGVSNPFKIPGFKQRAEQTLIEKYGRPNSAMLSEGGILERIRKNGITTTETIENCSSGKTYKGTCSYCGREFEFHFHSARPTSCPYCRKRSTQIERQLTSWLADEGFNFIAHYTEIFEGTRKEIDIYFPEIKIGFEINGAFTHNSGFSPFPEGTPKPRSFHKEKSDVAEANGIALYHLWEHWGIDNLRSLILSKIYPVSRNKVMRIYARKLNLAVVKNEQKVIDFFNANHVHGFKPASFTVSLEKDGQIVMAASFVIRGDEAVLERLASKKFTIVVGGFSRLLSKADEVLKRKKIKRIKSSAYRDLTPSKEKSVYFRSGFDFIGDSGPMLYFYVMNAIYKDGVKIIPRGVFSREKFQKHKLESLNGSKTKNGDVFIFDKEKSAEENLSRLRIYPVYTSGCLNFVKNLSDTDPIK